MSLEKIEVDRIQYFLEQSAIINSVSALPFNDDINIALKTYLEKKETWILRFLLGEEQFSTALYEILTEDRSVETFTTICDYMAIHKPEQEILFLEEAYFSCRSDLCEHFSQTWYYLNNKQMAKIIAKWPDYVNGSEWVPVVRSYRYIDIQEKTLGNELYHNTISYDEEKKLKIQWDRKSIISFSRSGYESILYELNRLFADKTIYEVFDVDPVIILNEGIKK